MWTQCVRLGFITSYLRHEKKNTRLIFGAAVDFNFNITRLRSNLEMLLFKIECGTKQPPPKKKKTGPSFSFV